MRIPVILAALMPVVTLAGEVHSGHASAQLLVASSTFQPAKPVQAAIRLKVDPGWHTYWTNPGEGGMKLGAEWKLPEGWSAGPLNWPVPIRFKTGELPGFGYVGEVVIPVILTPPAAAREPVSISVRLDWLTCDDKACVPGDAAPSLELKQGEPAVTADAPLIEAALARAPRVVEGLKLEVSEEGKSLFLKLICPDGLDASRLSAFPASPRVVDPGAIIGFRQSAAGWTSTVPRSEYLDGPPKTLELVLSGDGLPHPAVVIWTGK